MFNGGTLFASESFMILFTFLPIIINLVLSGFGIYLVIKIIKFMNVKMKLDRDRNEKLDELIKIMDQGKKGE